MIKNLVMCSILFSTVLFAGQPYKQYSYHSNSISRNSNYRYNPQYIRPDINYARPNSFRGFDYFSNGRMVSRSIGVDRGQYFIFRR